MVVIDGMQWHPGESDYLLYMIVIFEAPLLDHYGSNNYCVDCDMG